MFLGSPLAFSLGGSAPSTSLPWIVNLHPAVDEAHVKMLSPVRFSLRDAETFIDPSTIRVKAGYASVFSRGTELFDVLPRTRRVTLGQGNALDPLIELTNDGVRIQKTNTSAQHSVYATSIDGGLGYQSVMITAVVRPDTLTPYDDDTAATPLTIAVYPGPLMPLPYSPIVSTSEITDNGTVLAIEHGPRNKAAYLRFQQHSDGTKLVRLTSFAKEDGSSPDINSAVVFDWDALRRYTLVWNEAEGYFELYGQLDDVTVRLFRVVLSNIPDMPSDYYLRSGTEGDITVLYGQLGPSGDASTWANIAVTTNVGYPVLGNIRPGSFVTTVRGAELFRTLGTRDPRDVTIGTWSTAPSSILGSLDAAAGSDVALGLFEMNKVTAGTSFALHREEPALLSSGNEGFMVQAKISARAYTVSGSSATGMGITVFDGQTVFQLQLFDDLGVRTVGLLKKGGLNTDITQHFLPSTAIDWKGQHLFRFVVDPRRAVLRFYDGDDLATALMDVPFDRATLPNAADFGWENLTPFLLIGHTMVQSSTGTFVLDDVSFCHLYQAWDAEDGNLPPASTPMFRDDTSGTATAVFETGALLLTAAPRSTKVYTRDALIGPNRGGIIEARLKITSWRPRTRTGVYALIDDGVHAYALSFVDSDLGKFVALAQRDAFGTFKEIVGRDGPGKDLSFLFDWTTYHTYRLERRPYEGVYVFVDDEKDPRISFPESKIAQLPDTYPGFPALAFGQYSGEGSTSHWSFVRGMFSRGYEISFKKNASDAVLRAELFNTQAIVVAHATDGIVGSPHVV